MATLEEDFKAYLTSVSAIKLRCGGRVHVDHVPQNNSQMPFVWLSQSSSANEDALDDSSGGPFRTSFDVEVYATTPFEAKTLHDYVRSALHLLRGTFGARTVQGVFVDTSSADYVPRAVSGDTGFTVRSLSVEVVG